jgi:hypothetical protein
MLFVNRYLNIKLKNVLDKIPKNNIFKIGEGGGKQLSGLYRYFGCDKSMLPLELIECYSLIEYNFESAKYNKLNIGDKYLLENREYHFKKNDKPFKGRYHCDMIEHTEKSCYTFVYYYNISRNIKGGEIEFEDGIKYKPKEYDIICFDGSVKHKVNKLYGEGIRRALIMNIEKNENNLFNDWFSNISA